MFISMACHSFCPCTSSHCALSPGLCSAQLEPPQGLPEPGRGCAGRALPWAVSLCGTRPSSVCGTRPSSVSPVLQVSKPSTPPRRCSCPSEPPCPCSSCSSSSTQFKLSSQYAQQVTEFSSLCKTWNRTESVGIIIIHVTVH